MKRFIGALLLVVAGLTAACNPSTTTEPSVLEPGASEDLPAESPSAEPSAEASPSPSP